MRLLIITAIVCLLSTAARAQEQESKLLDRLLKPNTTLANSSQNKQFAGGTEATTKKATVRSFFFRDRTLAREFRDTRRAAVRDFTAPAFSGRETRADLSSRGQFASRVGTYTVPDAAEIRTSSDSHKLVSSSDYAGNRTFTGRGKSQKILSAQDKPMSIDDVRELLNKSK